MLAEMIRDFLDKYNIPGMQEMEVVRKFAVMNPHKCPTHNTNLNKVDLNIHRMAEIPSNDPIYKSSIGSRNGKKNIPNNSYLNEKNEVYACPECSFCRRLPPPKCHCCGVIH